MCIYAEPLPKFADVADILFSQFLRKEKERLTFPSGVFYGYARQAMLDAALQIAQGKDSDIWFPAYICEELVAAFRTSWPGRVKFYDIKEDLTPDLESVNPTHSSLESVSIFVLVHYFGFLNAVDEAKEFCERQRMVLFEDAAHLLPNFNEGIKPQGDVAVFSLRKVLPLPDGALLVSSENQFKGGEEPLFAQTKIPWQWILRTFLKKNLRRFKVPFCGLRSLREGLNAARGQCGLEMKDFSYFSEQLFKKLVIKTDEVKKLRQKNYKTLQELLSEYGIEPIFLFRNDRDCPFVFPFRTEKREETLLKLRRKGIAAQFWPTLPVEVRESNNFTVAKKVQSEVVVLPVHQDLNEKDMSYIARVLRG